MFVTFCLHRCCWHYLTTILSFDCIHYHSFCFRSSLSSFTFICCWHCYSFIVIYSFGSCFFGEQMPLPHHHPPLCFCPSFCHLLASSWNRTDNQIHSSIWLIHPFHCVHSLLVPQDIGNWLLIIYLFLLASPCTPGFHCSLHVACACATHHAPTFGSLEAGFRPCNGILPFVNLSHAIPCPCPWTRALPTTGRYCAMPVTCVSVCVCLPGGEPGHTSFLSFSEGEVEHFWTVQETESRSLLPPSLNHHQVATGVGMRSRFSITAALP